MTITTIHRKALSGGQMLKATWLFLFPALPRSSWLTLTSCFPFCELHFLSLPWFPRVYLAWKICGPGVSLTRHIDST